MAAAVAAVAGSSQQAIAEEERLCVGRAVWQAEATDADGAAGRDVRREDGASRRGWLGHTTEGMAGAGCAQRWVLVSNG